MDNVALFTFVLGWVMSSRWASMGDVSALLILAATTLLILSRICYSSSVQRLWEDVRRLVLAGVHKVREASASPYDRRFANSRTLAWIVTIYFYLMVLDLLLVGAPFLLGGLGAVGADLPLYMRLVSLGFGMAVLLVAKVLKAQCDRQLHEMLNKSAVT